MTFLALLLFLAAVLAAPFLAQRIMGLKGGPGKGAFVGLITLGLMQMTGFLARYLGPLGDALAVMAFIAAWYQLVRIVHATDIAHTVVFMFWQVFFLLLGVSLIAALIGGRLQWLWGA